VTNVLSDNVPKIINSENSYWPSWWPANRDGRVVDYTEAEWVDEEGLRYTLAAGLAALRSERQRPELDRASTGLKAEEVILWGM
jgi:hypothetical protein